MCSVWFKQQWGSSISSDDGWALNMRQAIIGTNDCLVNWRIYASLGSAS